jgi:protocatechuate 3,4-dioxygenase alpha subunit
VVVVPVVLTPSQTAGPYVALGTAWAADGVVAGAESAGVAVIEIVGRLLDGAGAGVSDGMLEIWQADPQGRFPPDTAAGWGGFARSLTGADGGFSFRTVKPGPVAAGAAPHLALSVFARGMLQRLVTRMYFPDEAAANASDPVLASVGDSPARASLVAVAEEGRLRFDVHLQGERETVFFAG